MVLGYAQVVLPSAATYRPSISDTTLPRKADTTAARWGPTATEQHQMLLSLGD